MAAETIPRTLPEARTRRFAARKAGTHTKRRPDARSFTGSGVKALALIVIVVAGLVGLALRTWLIVHSPTTSDVAIVGLIAQGALHGHLTAFYWGQQYGGTAEPDYIALFFLVFGQNGWATELALATLSALAALLTWRVTLRLVPVPTVALLAGALTWAAPEVAVENSIRTYGFRGTTLACGLAMLLLALRVLDGRRGLINFAGLGLVAGIGWWSSPEIAYYAVPTLLIMVGAAVTTATPRWRAWVPAMLVTASTLLLGAAPWLWVNFKSGFASLNITPRPGATPRTGIVGRLPIFFHDVLPMQVGLRRVIDGVWLISVGGQWPRRIVFIVVGVTIVAALLLCLVRRGRTRFLGLGVLFFPILYALSPASWYWRDGRYGGYLPPLLAMVVAIGCCEGTRRLRRPPRDNLAASPQSAPIEPERDQSDAARTDRAGILAMSVVVVLSVILSAVAFSQVTTRFSRTFTSSWANPDAPTMSAIAKLEAAGVTTGYADYWVAYKLDFLSQGRLTITTAGYDADRSRQINAAVVASKRPAWLFVPTSESHLVGTQFTAPTLIVGPDGVPESQFLSTLHKLGVHYRIIDTGIVQAVVPLEPVSQLQAQLPGVSAG